jgi:acyl carrier protein
MIPATFAMLPELPKTPNGKVDRQALQALETKRQHSDFVAARTYLEEIVAGIWAKILGLEQVGIYDNFFELGGHSLLATQVVSQLRQVLEIELPVRCLFELPTVSELSHRIETTMKLGGKNWRCLLSAFHGQSICPYPLLKLDCGFWSNCSLVLLCITFPPPCD